MCSNILHQEESWKKKRTASNVPGRTVVKLGVNEKHSQDLRGLKKQTLFTGPSKPSWRKALTM